MSKSPPTGHWASPSPSDHRRNPRHLDARAGARRVRTARRPARENLGSLYIHTARPAPRATAIPPAWMTATTSVNPNQSSSIHLTVARRPPGTTARDGSPTKQSCCSIKTAIPSSRPAVPTTRRAQWRSSMPEGHRRRRREACWTATSTAASSPQTDAEYQDPAPFIRGSSPPLTRAHRAR